MRFEHEEMVEIAAKLIKYKLFSLLINIYDVFINSKNKPKYEWKEKKWRPKETTVHMVWSSKSCTQPTKSPGIGKTIVNKTRFKRRGNIPQITFWRKEIECGCPWRRRWIQSAVDSWAEIIEPTATRAYRRKSRYWWRSDGACGPHDECEEKLLVIHRLRDESSGYSQA